MKNKLISALILAGAAVATQGAHAASSADGTVSFEGAVTSQTCTINGNGTTSSDFTVALPTVSASTLAVAGNANGRTRFSIALSGCPLAGNVFTSFGAGPTIDTTTGALILNAGGATNAEIQLLNSDLTVIVAGAANASQNSLPVAVTVGGSATLNYYAQYLAVNGAATAGAANSSVTYTITYL